MAGPGARRNVTHGNAPSRGAAYDGDMPILRTLLSGLPLVALPAMAADSTPVPTGITGIGPSAFIFTIAAALLATLLCRAMTRRATHAAGRMLGRWRIRRMLRSLGPHALHDAILPGAYGGLARIDHALLTAGGILCIRAVHLDGKIAGGQDDAQWSHVDGSRTGRLLNPLIQNEGRVRAIRKVLRDVPVRNLVVFTGRVEFAGTAPSNVLTLDRLPAHIASFASEATVIDDIGAAWSCLLDAVLTGEDARKDFAAQISFS